MEETFVNPNPIIARIDEIIASIKSSSCCSYDEDTGYAYCGIPCRDGCCQNGEKFCKEPCYMTVEWNRELGELRYQLEQQ